MWAFSAKYTNVVMVTKNQTNWKNTTGEVKRSSSSNKNVACNRSRLIILLQSVEVVVIVMPTEVVGKYKDPLKDKYVGESKKQLRHGTQITCGLSVIDTNNQAYNTAQCNRSRAYNY